VLSTPVASATAAGAAGAPDIPSVEPAAPIDIAGRWAMFHFEDPVGVQVTEDGVGNLMGFGCASGTPPLDAPELSPSYCGDVQGTVQENRAYFDFKFQGYDYIADTTVSADGQRMTGRFHGAVDWLTYPTAWLRVPDGDPGLLHSHSLDDPPSGGRYDLRLTDAAPGATEYVRDHVYSLSYYGGRLISDFGAFWYSEIAPPDADGAFAVGPVPMTDPALAISMVLHVTGTLISQVSAVTGSGHEYVFAATPTPVQPPSPR
jgi:hypothetical protein